MARSRQRSAPQAGASPLIAALAAIKQDPQKSAILVACTTAAAATVFEPGYLTLSTSAIQAGLRAENSQAPMVFAVAFLLLAILTLIGGTSADILGRRLFLMIGLFGLAASNLLALLSMDTPKVFAVADIVNAISGVLVLPAAIAIITLTFDTALRPFAFAILFTAQGTAMVVGNMLIPWFGDAWDGRATFLPVLALCVLAVVLILRVVPESQAPTSLRRGSIVVNVVIMAGVFAMVFLIVTGGIRSPQTLLAILVALALLLFAAVVRWLSRRVRFFHGIEVHGGRDLGLAIFAGVMLTFAQGCFFFQITPFFYTVQQVGDAEGALRFVPYVIGLFAGALLITRLAVRLGARRILAISFLTMGVALFALSGVTADSPFWVMIVPIALIGLSAGIGGPARTTVVVGAPPEGLVGSSAAVNTAAGQVGYALGTIVSSVLVTRYADRIFVDGLTAAGVSPETVARVTSGLQSTLDRLVATGYPGLPDAVKALTGVSYGDAFASGMTQMFLIVAIAMIFTAIVILVGMHRGLRATLTVRVDGTGPRRDSDQGDGRVARG